MKINIYGTKSKIRVKNYRTLAKNILGKYAKKKLLDNRQVLNIIFVNDSYIQKLNKEFLGRSRPTDVLAFPIGMQTWAEIYISRERAKIQAKEYKISAVQEICNLIEHGILHLLGYSHKMMQNTKD
jgi:rRNA maturation RNase YbeY